MAIAMAAAECTSKPVPADNAQQVAGNPAAAAAAPMVPASTDARAGAIEAALIALGWKDGAFMVKQDGPDIGRWQTFMAFTTNPSGTLVDVWAGPRADSDANEIIVSGQPLTRGQLRALVAEKNSLREVAHIVVRTAGRDSGLGDPETGSSRDVPGPLEGKVRAPGVDKLPAGDAFVFDARTLAGGYSRVTASLAGDGPVTLELQPIPGAP